MNIVFSIGGSILAPDVVDESYVKRLAAVLLDLSHRHRLAVVVGGGKPARNDIAKAREKGASWAECDHVGILATRRNAEALVSALNNDSNQKIPNSIHEATSMFGKKILVMGGTEPGHSTDAVAALIGDWVGAQLFINASNVDAVYDKNPQRHSDAKPIPVISVDALEKLLCGEGFNAGEYPLLDPTALKVIKRASIKTIILDGRDLSNMKAAADGQTFRGTSISV
jgi:uridylate kinase